MAAFIKYYTEKLLAVICLLAIFSACSPSRIVQPLRKNEHNLSASLGGPLIKYKNKPVPIPHSSVTYSYGVKDSMTAFASIYPTAAIFGNLQVDMGINFYVWRNDTIKMAVTLTPSLNYVRNFATADDHVWPVIDANFVRHYGLKQDYFYAGVSNWIETQKKRVDGLKQQDLYVPALQFGNVWSREKFNLTAEFKLILPYRSNQGKVVEYVKPIVPYGAMGIFIGYTYKFKYKPPVKKVKDEEAPE